jgi:hypothetical protein
MPTFGKAADNTALPQPPRTSQKVPMNSAVDRWARDIENSSGLCAASHSA